MEINKPHDAEKGSATIAAIRGYWIGRACEWNLRLSRLVDKGRGFLFFQHEASGLRFVRQKEIEFVFRRRVKGKVRPSYQMFSVRVQMWNV